MAVITAGKNLTCIWLSAKIMSVALTTLEIKKRQAEKPAIIVLRTFYVDTKIWKFKKGESK